MLLRNSDPKGLDMDSHQPPIAGTAVLTGVSLTQQCFLIGIILLIVLLLALTIRTMWRRRLELNER
jgi:hypothetical protein